MRNLNRVLMLVAAALTLTAATARGQTPDSDYTYDYDRVKIDRYLDVEVWTDHSDEEYYQGDNIVVYFRASRDCFVSIYSIDTRGRVNLLFPSEPGQDNFVYGGITNRLPGEQEDYDLEVTGPEGFEYLQIVASRERFDIPDWYHNSGLVSDAEDVNEYMDYLNTTYFVRYGGQRFAYDRAAIYVNEWEPYYFRPVYWPYYPSWSVYGNCYIDYPWGSSVYINGVYWGCTPLYIPRLVVGWHTITIYDRWHHCWESDFHVSRYNTMVFNRTVIAPSPTVKSKYKEVQVVGYRDPASNGYPDFETRKSTVTGELTMTPAVAKKPRSSTVGGGGSVVETSSDDLSLPKKYVRGSTKVVKTDRGFETDGATAVITSPKSSGNASHRKSTQAGRSSGGGDVPAFQGRTKSSNKPASGTVNKGTSSGQKQSGSSSGTYRKISGSSSTQTKQGGASKQPAPQGSSGAKVEKKSVGSGGSTSGKVEKKDAGGSQSSGQSKSGSSDKPAQGSDKSNSKSGGKTDNGKSDSGTKSPSSSSTKSKGKG